VEQPAQRHLKVLRLYAQGLTRRDIAAELFLSPMTVRAYLSQVCEILDARNSVHAVTICLARGYLCVDGRTGDVYVPVPLEDAFEERVIA
jgi:DNA-binding CsgD family transcriptional regulator